MEKQWRHKAQGSAAHQPGVVDVEPDVVLVPKIEEDRAAWLEVLVVGVVTLLVGVLRGVVGRRA